LEVLMDDVRSPVATGGCQCGAVRYALLSLPEGSVCHCRMCQKAVGGPFAALARLPKADVVWTRGRPAVFRSSASGLREFCRDCGTPLTFAYDDAGHMEVTIGSLDRPVLAPPGRAFGVESRLAWVVDLVPGRLPEMRSDELPPRDRTSRQHPDHATPDDWKPL
jgi:hypothetical protein